MKKNILIEGAHPHLILFDGVCNLCTGTVMFILRWEKAPVLKFTSLQSPDGIIISRELKGSHPELDSLVLVRKGRVYTHSSAALRIAGYLRFPLSLAPFFLGVPKFIRDGVYKFIARNRYRWFGKKSVCMVPEPGLRARFLDQS